MYYLRVFTAFKSNVALCIICVFLLPFS